MSDNFCRLPVVVLCKKEKIWNLFRMMTQGNNFDQTRNRMRGTHSIRKYPDTYLRRNRCSYYDVDARRSWKSNCCLLNTYIDYLVPYPDAKGKGFLCILLSSIRISFTDMIGNLQKAVL